MTESSAEIADDVSQFIAVSSADMDDLVVRVFQVPVVDQRHHNLQTLKLRRASEWIAFPFPLCHPIPVVRTCFEPHVVERSLAGNRDAWDQVIDLSHVTHTPQQSDR